jgi:hypothetical protein
MISRYAASAIKSADLPKCMGSSDDAGDGPQEAIAMVRSCANPHPTPDPVRLTRVLDQTLFTLIAVRRAGNVPEVRLQLAGVPPLVILESERRRREAAHLKRVAS